MARPVYPYEISDPDFAWLLETFQENNPGYQAIQETCLPIVLIKEDRGIASVHQDAMHEFEAGNPFEELLSAPIDSEEEPVDDNT